MCLILIMIKYIVFLFFELSKLKIAYCLKIYKFHCKKNILFYKFPFVSGLLPLVSAIRDFSFSSNSFDICSAFSESPLE